jgi:hypothetical protein
MSPGTPCCIQLGSKEIQAAQISHLIDRKENCAQLRRWTTDGLCGGVRPASLAPLVSLHSSSRSWDRSQNARCSPSPGASHDDVRSFDEILICRFGGWSSCLTIRLHVRSSCAYVIARTISGSYRSCGCTISLTSEGLNSYLKSRTSKN